jgi:hypothetical protein
MASRATSNTATAPAPHSSRSNQGPRMAVPSLSPWMATAGAPHRASPSVEKLQCAPDPEKSSRYPTPSLAPPSGATATVVTSTRSAPSAGSKEASRQPAVSVSPAAICREPRWMENRRPAALTAKGGDKPSPVSRRCSRWMHPRRERIGAGGGSAPEQARRQGASRSHAGRPVAAPSAVRFSASCPRRSTRPSRRWCRRLRRRGRSSSESRCPSTVRTGW